MPPKKIVATHVKDVEWIIALWFAIHGGDPPPHEVLTTVEAEKAAAELRAAAAHLPAAKQKAVVTALSH
jgi:hypothetical protein